MKLETIIDMLGTRINRKFILLRQNFPNNTFKLYSTYRLALYEKVVKSTNKVLEYSKVYKVNDDKAIDNIEQEFLKSIFDVYVQ